MAGRVEAGSGGREIWGGPGDVLGGLVFAAAATAGIALVRWLALRGVLPVSDGAGFVGTLSGWSGSALGAWMAAVALVSLGLPAITLAVWGWQVAVRRALLAYVVVLVVQISVEMIFSGVFFPDIVVLTGMAFKTWKQPSGKKGRSWWW